MTETNHQLLSECFRAEAAAGSLTLHSHRPAEWFFVKTYTVAQTSVQKQSLLCFESMLKLQGNRVSYLAEVARKQKPLWDFLSILLNVFLQFCRMNSSPSNFLKVFVCYSATRNTIVSVIIHCEGGMILRKRLSWTSPRNQQFRQDESCQ